MVVLAFLSEPDVVRKILLHLEVPADLPPTMPTRRDEKRLNSATHRPRDRKSLPGRGAKGDAVWQSVDGLGQSVESPLGLGSGKRASNGLWRVSISNTGQGGGWLLEDF